MKRLAVFCCFLFLVLHVSYCNAACIKPCTVVGWAAKDTMPAPLKTDSSAGYRKSLYPISSFFHNLVTGKPYTAGQDFVKKANRTAGWSFWLAIASILMPTVIIPALLLRESALNNRALLTQRSLKRLNVVKKIGKALAIFLIALALLSHLFILAVFVWVCIGLFKRFGELH